MAHEDDLSAATQELPQRLVGRRARGNGKDERREQKAQSHHETRRDVECSIGGAMSRIARRQLLHGTLATAVVAAARPARAQVADEEALRQLETFGGLLRDPEKYYVSIFGTPAAGVRWGWRLEGHHLSLNFTLAPGRPVSVTPAFFGANPAEVPSGPNRGLRTLADEQDLAVALARGVDPRLHGRFVIAAESPGDIVSGPGRSDSLRTPAGITLGDLGAEPRTLALRLVEIYARNMRTDLADEELRRMREAGAENVRFAWAGAIDPRQPHYYRLHGPTLLIEYDNSQNRANHIHSVWHDPRNDFGVDLLRAHYEDAHPRHA